MEIYTISFFGHRCIYQTSELEEKLESILRDIINSHEYVEFLIGKDGDFDRIASSCIKRVKRDYEYKCSHIWVMPYVTDDYLNNAENYKDYYDEIEVCEESCNGYFKKAFQIRNYSMVDRSNLVICYVENKTGGAFNAMKYAIKSEKDVLNLAVL